MAGGCSQMPASNANGNGAEAAIDADPFEPFNRLMHSINQAVDTLVLRPIAYVYREVVPDKGREMVSNAVENVYTPVVFANSVLQADPQNSFASFWSFVLNSTVGIGGLFDVASEAGLKYRSTDLGQTFAIYGADTGPYLVLPLIGPSNVRDAFGRLGDAFMNPFNYVDEGFSLALWSVTAVDARATHMKLIDDVYRDSLDPYATFRSGYTQKRASDIRKAKEARKKSLENALCRQ